MYNWIVNIQQIHGYFILYLHQSTQLIKTTLDSLITRKMEDAVSALLVLFCLSDPDKDFVIFTFIWFFSNQNYCGYNVTQS